jgi:hypothetical protein
MGKLEKEIKILNVNKKEIEIKLQELGARKIEESMQQIYVYDLPSICARFYDCIIQLENANKPYDFQICRNKLHGILQEVDNLTENDEQKYLQERYKTKYFTDLLNRIDDKKLLEVFSCRDIIEIIKKYGINPNKWVRVRQTNGRTTITIKHILNPDIQKGTKSMMQSVMETEMEVPSIEEANAILEQLGYAYRNYQEKNRETYDCDGVEIDIDSWPLIPTYIEIENDSLELIKKTVGKLGLQNNEVVSCNTADVYKRYGIDLYRFRELKFSNSKNIERDIRRKIKNEGNQN